MTVEQLRKVHQARPFRPFTLYLADGSQVHVPHSEFLSHSPSGRTVIVHHDDADYSVIDLLLVSKLEVKSQAPSNDQSK
jgi:hypothetical protein